MRCKSKLAGGIMFSICPFDPSVRPSVTNLVNTILIRNSSIDEIGECYAKIPITA